MDYPRAPGYRFYPTEEELISFYLQKKLLDPNRQDLDSVIPLLDIYDFSPWDLPKYAGEICDGDHGEQWFFFIPRQRKEAQGGRPNRLAPAGYWKATGSPGFVYSSSNRVIGLKKTMVFYKGRAPKGSKTEWKLNEYRAAAAAPAPTMEGLQLHSSSSASTSSAIPQFRQELSLCRLYKRSTCLRLFDRRPSSSLLTIGEGSDQRVDHQQAHARSDHHEAAATFATTTSHHENQNSSIPILMVDTNTIMPSSSPSTDASKFLGDNSNTNNYNPSDYLNSDLPIWEWEWEWEWNWEPFNWINHQGRDYL